MYSAVSLEKSNHKVLELVGYDVITVSKVGVNVYRYECMRHVMNYIKHANYFQEENTEMFQGQDGDGVDYLMLTTFQITAI